MTNSEYKKFKEYVKTADEKDPVWWAGYMWINLTKRQAKDMIPILEIKPFVKETVLKNGEPALETPSGMAIWKNQEGK